MRKNLIKVLLLLLLSLTMTTLCFGCKNQKEAEKVEDEKIKAFFTEETIEVGFGENYTINNVVEDSEGKLHVMQYEVVAASGKEVYIRNKTFAIDEREGFKIIYNFAFNGFEYEKTVTLKVIGKVVPFVSVSDTKVKSVFFGEKYKFSKATAEDPYEGELNVKKEVYKVNGNEKTKVDVEVVNNKVLLTEAGKYLAVYSATNMFGVQSSKEVVFYVRNSAKVGEYESFDDEGVVYSHSFYKSYSYLPEFNGRTGVLRTDVIKNIDSPNSRYFWRLYSKHTDVLKYSSEGYTKIRASIYVDGPEGCISQIGFINTCSPVTNIATNQWIDVVFDVGDLFKTGSWGNRSGWTYLTTNEAASIYIDSIYFVKETDVELGSFIENGAKVKPTFVANEQPDTYSVTYNGEYVDVVDGYFDSSRLGEYVITPTYIEKDIYSSKTFTYVARNSCSIQLNAFDEYIAKDADSFTSPQVVKIVDGEMQEVLGYSTRCEITYVDVNGDSSTVTQIDSSKVGKYTFKFTAEKATERQIVKEVIVYVGFNANELINVDDANITETFVSSNTTELSQIKNEGSTLVDGMPSEFEGESFLKVGYAIGASTSNDTYLNLAMMYSKEDLTAMSNDRIRFNMFIGGDAKATCSTFTLDILGQRVILKANEMNEILISKQLLIDNYDKLTNETANSDLYFIKLTYGKVGENASINDDFNSLSVYISDVTVVDSSSGVETDGDGTYTKFY